MSALSQQLYEPNDEFFDFGLPSCTPSNWISSLMASGHSYTTPKTLDGFTTVGIGQSSDGHIQGYNTAHQHHQYGVPQGRVTPAQPGQASFNGLQGTSSTSAQGYDESTSVYPSYSTHRPQQRRRTSSNVSGSAARTAPRMERGGSNISVQSIGSTSSRGYLNQRPSYTQSQVGSYDNRTHRTSFPLSETYYSQGLDYPSQLPSFYATSADRSPHDLHGRHDVPMDRSTNHSKASTFDEDSYTLSPLIGIPDEGPFFLPETQHSPYSERPMFHRSFSTSTAPVPIPSSTHYHESEFDMDEDGDYVVEPVAASAPVEAPKPKKVWQCPETCGVSPFKRKADMERHYNQVHNKDNLQLHDCWFPKCPRKGPAPKGGFGRKDHLLEHLRNFHHLEIPKTGGGKRPKAYEDEMIDNDQGR